MPKAVITICYIVCVPFVFSSILHIPGSLKNRINKNGTSEKSALKESHPISLNKLGNYTVNNQQISNGNETEIKNNTSEAKSINAKEEHQHYTQHKAFESIPILQKIHARITRSKNAVWATVTLTFICVLLVLSVAQSRMWKDHYYIESQGVPLPNFNERVLFKDVMERRISTMKKFFKKKKSKENDETELESLLPPSEWDS